MISLMLKILERESDNEGRIFLYLEEGKWVGYDRSALYLCRLVKDLPIVSHVVEGIFWLLKGQHFLWCIHRLCLLLSTT